MPQVPGVSMPGSQDASGPKSALNPALLTLGIVAFLVVGGLVAYFALRPARQTAKEDRAAPVANATEKPVPAAASGANSRTPTPASAQPDDAPRPSNGPITIQELAEPWSSRTFLFRRGLTGETVQAIIIRLPQGEGSQASSYWAIALKDPFGSCQLEYITDLNRISNDYGFPARHPMVCNPCNRAVFDPLQTATLVSGAWARGAVVHGSALRPPMAIDVRIYGDQIFPVQME